MKQRTEYIILIGLLTAFAATLVIGSRLVSADGTARQQYESALAEQFKREFVDDSGDSDIIDIVYDSNSIYDLTLDHTCDFAVTKPTHCCPIHGEMPTRVWSTELLVVNDTEFCAKCVYDYLEAHLKENIPQLTKIEP